MHNHLNNTVSNAATDIAQPVAGVSKYTAAALAASVGIVLLFIAGFAETGVLHNAAHDSRHSVVFPCH
ncbi:MAG: CbtB-domain containing protein [Gammaproteobacteria bacterium]|nr:CbtB-domain containing protein [Gammaproteobacteria bacterium]MCF6260356.1 CbtB-domain containing protein [Gammaproteobacteria bacterium]